MHSAMAMLVTLVAAGNVFAGQAQEAPKVTIEIDGAYRATSQTLTDTASPTINAEPAKLTTTYTSPSAMTFAGGGAVRIWKQLGAGVSVSRHSTSADGEITGSIPHPFVFSQPREIEGVAGDLQRQELGIALQMRALIPLSERFAMTLSGGPVWTSVTQDVVTDVQYSETYPYDSASYRSSTQTQAKGTAVGLAVGGDVAYFFSKQVGLGVGVRFSGGSVELPASGDRTIKSTVGGLDIGAGLRVRF